MSYGPPKNIIPGGGTLDDPDKGECPKCGSAMWPGYDEDEDGGLHGDGTWQCEACRYFWEGEYPLENVIEEWTA